MSLSNPAWWGVVGLAWIAAAGPGEVEGYFSPPSTPMILLSETVTGNDEEGFVAEFTAKTFRVRARCGYRRVEWFLGPRRGVSSPTDVVPEKPKLRPSTGEITLKGWTVYLGNVESIHDTHADVIHRCRVLGINLPWETRSRLWDGEKTLLRPDPPASLNRP